ncbi:MAG: PilZ domain-containing protein [Deltaproteobacteria bacterium]
MSSTVRQHPRFIDERKVEVGFGSREALKEAWTVDISKGGMFIRTETPPAFGTQLTIHLSTPDGMLELDAEVVHVVSTESAAAFNQPPGIGVQFVSLDDDSKTRIEEYVDGVAARLSADLGVEREYEPLDVLIADAKRIMDALSASKLYAALDVEPGATRDAIELRVQTMCERFSDAPPDSPPPKVARLEQVVRQLERASELVANPLRRLHYDFHHSHLRIDERRAAGEDFTYLREVWTQAFPEKVERAKALVQQAMELSRISPEQCGKLALSAQDLDPFNEELRAAYQAWVQGQEAQATAPPANPAPATDAVVQELLAFAALPKKPDHFALLGVAKNADAETISKAFFDRARRFHPDTLRATATPEVLAIADQLQAALNEAYRTLNHPAARAAYLQQTEPKPARDAKKDEQDALMAFEMAKVHLRKGAAPEARELLERAHTLDATNPQYAAFYAWSMIMDRHFDRATALSKGKQLLEAAIEKARKDGPKDPILIGQWHYYLGRLHRDKGDLNEAISNYDKALALHPHLREARMEKRVIEMRRDKKASG